MKFIGSDLKDFLEKLSEVEKKICSNLSNKILSLGDIAVLQGNKTYDLAFKSLEKSYKPTFAAFITNTHMQEGVWHKNDVRDSIVVVVRFKNIRDPDLIENPENWEFWANSIDRKKGWFSFRIDDEKPDTVQYAFNIVKQAYDSF